MFVVCRVAGSREDGCAHLRDRGGRAPVSDALISRDAMVQLMNLQDGPRGLSG